MDNFWTFDGIDDTRIALLVPGEKSITYGELSSAANHWATRLRTAADKSVPLVALEFTTTPDAIAAYLGVLRAGLPVLIVEPGKLGADSQLARVWNPDLHISPGPNGISEMYVRSEWHDGPALHPPPHPDLRVLLSTSGSTGEPKLVRLSGKNIAANAASIAEYLDITPIDRAATTLPLFYSYGLSVLNSYLSAGASLVLESRPITDGDFWKNAQVASVTSLALVPHHFNLLRSMEFTGTELPSLRYVTQAGGKLDPGEIEHFWSLGQAAGWRLFIMYGQTEAAPRISYVPPETLPGAADTIGRSIPGGRLWISAEDGSEILATGQPGELVYEGPNVMMGYATSRPDLTRGAELTKLKTGDVAERMPSGYVRIVGRLKRFAKLYGLRLSLDQVEASLRQHGIVAHAVAPDDRLVILCQNAGDEVAAKQMISDVYGLPPSDVHTGRLESLPLLSSGKIDQQGLRQLASEIVERSRDAQRVMTDQASLTEVMRWATRRARVQQSDTFVSLGGDSLSYLQVQMALEERLGYAPRGWERMTIAQLDLVSRSSLSEVNSRRPSGVSVGVDVPLRLLAISMIVVQHATTFAIFGGAWVLLAVMGFSAARFQVQLITAGRPLAVVSRMLYPIIPLYFMLLLIYAVVRDPVPLRYWLMIGNYEPWTGGSLLVVYWFVSVYTQIVIVLALVAAFGPARRMVAKDSWRVGAVAIVVLILILLVLAISQTLMGGLPYIPQRGLLECLSLFVIGWMLQAVKDLRQQVVTAILASVTVLLLAALDMTPQVVLVVAATLVLLGCHIEFKIPSRWARMLNQLASMTLYVYLVHQIVIHFLHRFQFSQAALAVLALLGSFALAAICKRAFDAIDRAMVARRGKIALRRES